MRVCVCVCVVTWGDAKALLLLFPATIRPVLYELGHDLLMHVFKKFRAVPTTARLFFPLRTGGEESQLLARRHECLVEAEMYVIQNNA